MIGAGSEPWNVRRHALRPFEARREGSFYSEIVVSRRVQRKEVNIWRVSTVVLVLFPLVALSSGCTVEPESEVMAAFGLPEVELGMRLKEVEERRPGTTVGGYGVYIDSTMGRRVEYSFRPARSNDAGAGYQPTARSNA